MYVVKFVSFIQLQKLLLFALRVKTIPDQH